MCFNLIVREIHNGNIFGKDMQLQCLMGFIFPYDSVF